MGARVLINGTRYKKDKLIPTIETVIAAVEAGELDGVLVQMSKTAVMMKGKRAA
jgi:hypothetical protein